MCVVVLWHTQYKNTKQSNLSIHFAYYIDIKEKIYKKKNVSTGLTHENLMRPPGMGKSHHIHVNHTKTLYFFGYFSVGFPLTSSSSSYSNFTLLSVLSDNK